MKPSLYVLFLVVMHSFTFGQSQIKEYPFEISIVGNGSPIVLIPGLGCSGEVWDDTVSEFMQDYQCHVITPAGYAGSRAVTEDKAFISTISEGISRYIELEIDEPVIILAHSIGGSMAIQVANETSTSLVALIILDTYPFPPLIQVPQATEDLMKPQMKQVCESFKVMPDSVFAATQQQTLSGMIANHEQVVNVLDWQVGSDRYIFSQAMYEYMTTDLRGEVATIESPILVLGSWVGLSGLGIDSTMVKNELKNQYGGAANVTVKIAERAKHFIQYDDLDWMMMEINTFIDGQR